MAIIGAPFSTSRLKNLLRIHTKTLRDMDRRKRCLTCKNMGGGGSGRLEQTQQSLTHIYFHLQRVTSLMRGRLFPCNMTRTHFIIPLNRNKIHEEICCNER